MKVARVRDREEVRSRPSNRRVGQERGPLVDGSARVHTPTLWDLATIVLEEVERVCVDQRFVRVLTREVLILMINGHVKNMEVIEQPPFRKEPPQRARGR
jgi:hypothetical protein